MTAHLVNELGALTGKEAYYLSVQLADAMSTSAAAAVNMCALGEDPAPWTAMHTEFKNLHADVAMQAARIDMPLVKALQIVARYMFSRGRPVRVAGT